MSGLRDAYRECHAAAAAPSSCLASASAISSGAHEQLAVGEGASNGAQAEALRASGDASDGQRAQVHTVYSYSYSAPTALSPFLVLCSFLCTVRVLVQYE